MVGTFSDIATNHLQLQSFNSGSLSDLDIEKLDADKFPLLYITPQPAIVDAHTLTYSFDVVVADQIQEDMTDIDDTYSETLLIIKDVILISDKQCKQSHGRIKEQTLKCQ